MCRFFKKSPVPTPKKKPVRKKKRAPLTDAQLIEKYGMPETNQLYCHPAYPLRLAWATDITITKFKCHKSVKIALEGLFNEVLEAYGYERIKELGLDLFGGCLNNRKMRNGSRMSKHSWGIAIDIDPAHNRLRWKLGKARLSRPEYKMFWDIVEKWGFYSQGRELNSDWMHFAFEPY